MDPGFFLTNSGSKIPKPKSTKEVAVVAPLKPKLTTTEITLTNYKPVSEPVQTPHTMESKQAHKGKANGTSTLKATRSIPNIHKATAPLTRCKTVLNPSKSGPSTLKRTAPGEVVEAPASKQPKQVPKSGFPYKAKNWELKLRLSECEEWVTEWRSKYSELESLYNSHLEELEGIKNYKEEVENTRMKLELQVTALQEEKVYLQNSLISKTDMYDKLRDDSKDFVSKIEKLEDMVTQRDRQITVLQTDQSKLREDILSKDSSISQLRFSVDDLEFKTRRQKSQIEDLENSLAQHRKENNELQSRLRDRDDLISSLQDKLDKSERDNKYKTSTISDLEEELMKAKSKINELQNNLSEYKSENTNLKEKLEKANIQTSELKAFGEGMSTTCDELKTKLCESEKNRRILHNTVQDLKGNIRVFCRVRPPIPSEKENAAPLCSINFPDEGSLEISKSDPFMSSSSNLAASRPKFVKHEFSFDKVFNPSASQEDVFTELSQLVQSALDGYNVCVFAYGQTGSGKTYTMEGPNESQSRGMIPRTVDHIFKTLEELKLIGWDYTVEVSFLEIYNEIIRDLLRNDKEGSSLKIMQVDGKTNDVNIPGLTVMKVNSYEDLDRLYVLAHQNRAVAYTSCNERSSRSHSVTRIKVTGVHQERGERCYGSLYLVDLAGSERLNEPMSDPRFREMKNINKSLSELGNVILGLLQKQDYIPYRNSKLTHLLQPALGGSSKTLMLVNISPAENCLQETLCSLRFAEKVNRVKMGTSKKRIAYDSSNVVKQ